MATMGPGLRRESDNGSQMSGWYHSVKLDDPCFPTPIFANSSKSRAAARSSGRAEPVAMAWRSARRRFQSLELCGASMRHGRKPQPEKHFRAILAWSEGGSDQYEIRSPSDGAAGCQ